MALPNSIQLVEVGPREGFQFEGIGQPDKLRLEDKLSLIDQLGQTGLRAIQMVSFVSPKQVPQMADAETICTRLVPRAGVRYTGIYLNDVGLHRAIATGKLAIDGKLTLTASETFSQANQRRSAAEDRAMQRRIAAVYAQSNIPITTATIMAAFGCNDEGRIPTATVLALAEQLHDIAAETGSSLATLILADTMGWADPELIRRTVATIQSRWPALRIGLHLHDTRGLAIANAMAGLAEGVDLFETAIGGLGGCPFAGNQGAAGNICTEEVVFLCHRLGIETGVALPKLVECARFAQAMVGHSLPSKTINASLEPRMPKSE